VSTASDGPYIGSLTRRVWQWVRHEIHRQVADAGFDDLNPAHVGLFRNPGFDGKRPGELAEEMQVTKQSVNELLGHLERRGYLVREADPDDSRSRRIRLTAQGRRLEGVVWAAAAEAERKAGAEIGEERMDGLRRTLADLVAALGI
jgi:DNA-binding MarR family transcriptional regulator